MTLRAVLRRAESRRGIAGGRAIPLPGYANAPASGGSPGRRDSATTQTQQGWLCHPTLRGTASGEVTSTRGLGVTGSSGTGRAQRRRCLPLCPCGGRIGKARRSVCLSALPRRQGAGTWPGSPAARGGSPAATGYQPRHRPVRGRLRRPAVPRRLFVREPWPVSHSALPAASRADAGSARPFSGHAAVVAVHARMLQGKSYAQALGKRACTSRTTAVDRVTSVACMVGEQG
jgi:hypothetical protein